MTTLYQGTSGKDESEVVRLDPPTGSTNIKTDGHELSKKINYFLKGTEQEFKNLSENTEKIKVSEVLGVFARMYEKIRTTIEYKGEHVLRRNAIERIFRRLAWEKGSLRPNLNSKRIAESIVRELIWARYIKNNFLPLSLAAEVENCVEKYFWLLENLDNFPGGYSKKQVKDWIIGVASSEIEDILDPSNRDIYIQLMQQWFIDNFDWTDTDLSEHNKKVQIYLAIHRALMKSDDAIMRYYLLIQEFPEWLGATKDEAYKLATRFSNIMTEIESHLGYTDKYILYRIMQKHAPAFEIFKEIAKDEKLDLGMLLRNKKKFNEKIRTVCEARYKTIKMKVRTGIIRSIIYIFISKVVFAMLLEIPFEIYKYGDIRYTPLFINIGFPPFLMWLIGMSIGIPGAKNTEIIVEKINSFVYETDIEEKSKMTLHSKTRKGLIVSIFGLFYMLLFLLVFGGVTYVLIQLQFSFFGILVFFAFMSLVLLFAYRIRYSSSQLRVDSAREGIFLHLSNYLTLPFLNLGFFLSKGLAKINFLTIVLDFLIEAPLKNVIELFEDWISYVREKREEVVELPE
jgi:hypothetical protein